MEESTCHEMVIYLSQRFSSNCSVYSFLHFFVSFEYDFHLDTERMIVKPQKNVKKYLRRWFKQNNVGHDISSIWKYCRYL